MTRTRELAIVGGGVIGLSLAWQTARVGHTVTVIDPEPASGTSWVAGGMLAPVAEAWPGDERLLTLGSTSLRQWPEFAAQLAADSGEPEVLRRTGTLVVGVDSADRDDLGRLADYLAHLGRPTTALTGRQLREKEPGLGPSVRSGLHIPDDLAVDNRAVLRCLRKAAELRGVQFLQARAQQVGPRTVQLAPENGDVPSTVSCDVVILAAGAHSAELYPALGEYARPVMGEILRLRPRRNSLPAPTRTIRGPVRGRPTYLVPRENGEVVLGATEAERGFDTAATVAGVRDLLASAEQFMPTIAEYELAEVAAGLRPGTRDNLPLLGWLEPNLLAATGHYRGGFLLAPLTSTAILDLLDRRPFGERLDGDLAHADVSRLNWVPGGIPNWVGEP